MFGSNNHNSDIIVLVGQLKDLNELELQPPCIGISSERKRQTGAWLMLESAYSLARFRRMVKTPPSSVTMILLSSAFRAL